MGFGMETTILQAVLVEFGPGFCFELAVHPRVLEMFSLKRGQKVDREYMERIIRANNEVMKGVPAPDEERFVLER